MLSNLSQILLEGDLSSLHIKCQFKMTLNRSCNEMDKVKINGFTL